MCHFGAAINHTNKLGYFRHSYVSHLSRIREVPIFAVSFQLNITDLLHKFVCGCFEVKRNDFPSQIQRVLGWKYCIALASS